MERWRYVFDIILRDDDDAEKASTETDASPGPTSGWCAELFTRLRATHRLPRVGAEIEWLGWRREPFMYGLDKMVLIAVTSVAGEARDAARRGAGTDEASDEMLLLIGTHADLVQSVRVCAQARIGDNVEDDAFRTCRRLFLDIPEAQANLTSCGAPTILSHDDVEQLLGNGWVVLDAFVPPSVAASASRLLAASIEADPVVGRAAAAAASPPSSPDKRPLRWRWPEPRTARGDCTAWVDCAFATELPASLAELVLSQEASSAAAHAAAVPDLQAADVPSEARDAAADFQAVLVRLEVLQAQLVACAAAGRLLGERELQVACYAPGGSGYQRHTDALPDDGMAGGNSAQRKLTAICYCNGGWAEEHGGALRLTLQDHQGGGTVDVAPIAGRCLVFMSGCMPHEVLPSFALRYAVTAWYW